MIRTTSIADSVWSFLNSSFGLYLFSTLLIGGGVWLYNESASAKKLTYKQELSIQKLDSEISARLIGMGFTAYLNRPGVNADSSVLNASDSASHSIFPELQSRNLLSLLWELETLLKAKGLDSSPVQLARNEALFVKQIDMLKTPTMRQFFAERLLKHRGEWKVDLAAISSAGDAYGEKLASYISEECVIPVISDEGTRAFVE